MKRIAILTLAALCVGGPLLGAEQDMSNKEARKRLWDASLKVMRKHFLVRRTEKSRGRIVADSRISSRGGQKTRVRAESRLLEDKDGLWDVEVRMTHQVEISMPTTFGRYQSRYNWQSVSFDDEGEAKLVNEIKAEAFGEAKALPTKFMKVGSPEGKTYPPSRLVIPGIGRKGSGGRTEYRPLARPSHLVLIVAPKRRPSKQVVPLMVRGEEEFRQGKYRDAATTFREALMADPHPAVKVALGHSLFALGDYGVAAATVRDGIKSVADVPGMKVDPRDFYGERKDFDGHRARLEAWLAKHPRDRQATFLLAYVCYFSGDRDTARRLFTSLLAADESDSAAKSFVDRLRREPPQPASGAAVVQTAAP